MIDLQTQLAKYGDFHDEAQAPITALEIYSGSEKQVAMPVAPDAFRSSRGLAKSIPRPLAAALAAILVLFLLGVIPLWLSGGEPDPVIAPTPQDTTTTTNTVPPSTAPEGASAAIEPTDLDMTATSVGTLGWTRISGDAESLPLGSIEPDPNGSGYVVHDLDDGSVWRSSDGFAWVRDAAAAPRDPADWVAPWVSEDGAGWSLPESLFPAGAQIFEVEFGWVATDMPQSRHVFAISTDGESWEEVLGPPGPHEPSGRGISAAGAVGDLIWVLVAEDAGSRTLWIGTFRDRR